MKFKKTIATLMTALCILGLFSAGTQPVMADQITVPYLALGADLNSSEKAAVLDLLDISESDLDQYMVVTVTNQEEKDYLGSYLDASVIGSRALSSVVVEMTDPGSGISVTTSNITYCTTGMYQNALATAGIKDASIRVAGPFALSGTAALVGAMKAYGTMTGQVILPENADAATAELVTTSELGQIIGDKQKAEELIAAVKQIIVAEDINNPEQIKEVITEAAQELKVQLSDEDVERIKELMEKISELDIDVDLLKEQVKDLYDKIESLDLDITKEDVEGFFDTLIAWLKELWHAIKEWLGL